MPNVMEVVGARPVVLVTSRAEADIMGKKALKDIRKLPKRSLNLTKTLA